MGSSFRVLSQASEQSRMETEKMAKWEGKGLGLGGKDLACDCIKLMGDKTYERNKYLMELEINLSIDH